VVQLHDILASGYYLRQGGNVFAGFCLFVCLWVHKITQKVKHKLPVI